MVNPCCNGRSTCSKEEAAALGPPSQASVRARYAAAAAVSSNSAAVNRASKEGLSSAKARRWRQERQPTAANTVTNGKRDLTRRPTAPRAKPSSGGSAASSKATCSRPPRGPSRRWKGLSKSTATRAQPAASASAAGAAPQAAAVAPSPSPPPLQHAEPSRKVAEATSGRRSMACNAMSVSAVVSKGHSCLILFQASASAGSDGTSLSPQVKKSAASAAQQTRPTTSGTQRLKMCLHPMLAHGMAVPRAAPSARCREPSSAYHRAPATSKGSKPRPAAGEAIDPPAATTSMPFMVVRWWEGG
mmetsp:Transcript_70909/g.184072  ORF Transcript_70909/g.184072 Transcript_70909/m.184072 type:complete len:302 (-) Transcript_70909:62-967(-)